MSNPVPRLKKWPFVASDLILCAAAGVVLWKILPAERPEELFLAGVCLLVGAWAAYLGLLPWLLEYRAAMKALELGELTSATEKLGHLNSISQKIEAATANWQNAQQQSAGLAAQAKESASAVVSRAEELAKSLDRGNEQERTTLRLEVEKLRKAEVEWLQVAVRMLDHTYALYNAARQSRQTSVISQIEKFQSACRDVARRVGLTPFEPRPDEPYNPKVHQLLESGEQEAEPAVEGAPIDVCVAPGFAFQGQIIRKPLVALMTAEQRRQEEAEPELPLSNSSDTRTTPPDRLPL